MRKAFVCAAVASLHFAGTVVAQSASDALRFWGQWRGPTANGVAPEARPPIEWSENKNIRWKVELPGQGLSTPIIWGQRVYIQAAVPADDRGDASGPATNDATDTPPRRAPRDTGGWNIQIPANPYTFNMMALDRRTGRLVWSRTLRREVPHEGSHPHGSLAAASPLTDGRRLYAYFGSHGLYCLDMRGQVLWEKDFGDMETRRGYGEGSSPVFHGDTLVVNWDHEGDSFIVALDRETGRERWRRSRDEPTSWATPIVVQDGARDRVVVSGTNRVRAYDLATGEDVWQCAGLGVNVIPSPVSGFGLIYAMSGYRGAALLAIRYGGANDDITGSDSVVWRLAKGTPYVPSALLYGDALYFLRKNAGIVSCYDAKTGTPNYEPRRLKGIDGVYASPIGAADRVYVVGRNGTTQVLARGAEYKVLAINRLSDEFSASPAAAGSELYLRGRNYLYCISTE